MLVQHGAPLFLENKENQTPCDSAEKGGHADIALYLESKMVFSADGPEEDEEDMFILPDSEVRYPEIECVDLEEHYQSDLLSLMNWFKVIHATFNNIFVISWQSVKSFEET